METGNPSHTIRHKDRKGSFEVDEKRIKFSQSYGVGNCVVRQELDDETRNAMVAYRLERAHRTGEANYTDLTESIKNPCKSRNPRLKESTTGVLGQPPPPFINNLSHSPLLFKIFKYLKHGINLTASYKSTSPMNILKSLTSL